MYYYKPCIGSSFLRSPMHSRTYSEISDFCTLHDLFGLFMCVCTKQEGSIKVFPVQFSDSEIFPDPFAERSFPYGLQPPSTMSNRDDSSQNSMTFAGTYHVEPIIIEPITEEYKDVQNSDWQDLKIDLTESPKFGTSCTSLDYEVEAIFGQDQKVLMC